MNEDSLTDEQREELRAVKQRAQREGDEPSSTYLVKIILDSFRAVVTALWAYRICDRLAIIAHIAAGKLSPSYFFEIACACMYTQEPLVSV
jgi:hypothetical protein